MRRKLLYIIIILNCFESITAQESSNALALDLPIRNSLMFNRYVISPTLSFAREDNRNIVLNNKRELVQVGDAPQTYMASFSGRFSEKVGAGVGIFQRNFGVFTTFGGIVNFAYNAQLSSESNLTFGLNLAAYSSGLNTGNVISTTVDPVLNDIPNNFLSSISPGINYGSGFLDVGLTVNNLVTYNISTSDILQEQTLRGIQGHLMYTGYIDSYNFFDNSKFSALGRAEFREDTSIYSGTIMLTVPKGFWVQGGYNTLYGGSAGIGLNITSQIALEYNYERSLNNIFDLGSSHELSLAFMLTRNRASDFRQKRIVGLLNFEKKRKRSRKKSTVVAQNETTTVPTTSEIIDTPQENTLDESEPVVVEEQARLAAAEAARLEAEEVARQEELEAQAQLAREEQARLAAAEAARLEAEEVARQEELEAQAQLAREEQARLAAAEAARLEAEEAARQEELEAQAQLAREEQARLAAAEAARLEAEEKAREEELEAQAQLAREEQARLTAESQIENPSDDLGRSLQKLTAETEASQVAQNTLLEQLENATNVLDNDLKDLKNENDLREQGVLVKPKPFKSVSKEKARIESLKSNLENLIQVQNAQISELQDVYAERVKKLKTNDETNQYYKDAIGTLTREREKTLNAQSSLISSLERIEIETQYERKRRIKRASFNNEKDRFRQDQAQLEMLKNNTQLSSSPIGKEAFDFGEPRSQNIQILKNVENVESGYYLILAVHGNAEKRDDFVKKVIASGNSQIQFFYDINTSKYYLYYQRANSLEEATRKMESDKNLAYNDKVSMIKIEN